MSDLTFHQPKILNTAQMARRLRVNTAWLKEQATTGNVPCLPAGKNFLFNPEAVENCLLERAAQPAQEASRA